MTTELEVARRLIAATDSPTAWLTWLKEQTRVEWTKEGEEPDVVKAIVLNQVLAEHPACQEAALDTLLTHVSTVSVLRIKALLKRQSVTRLLQKCVDRFNVLNGDSQSIELALDNDKKCPQLVITSKITVGSKEEFEAMLNGNGEKNQSSQRV